MRWLQHLEGDWMNTVFIPAGPIRIYLGALPSLLLLMSLALARPTSCVCPFSSSDFLVGIVMMVLQASNILKLRDNLSEVNQSDLLLHDATQRLIHGFSSLGGASPRFPPALRP